MFVAPSKKKKKLLFESWAGARTCRACAPLALLKQKDAKLAQGVAAVTFLGLGLLVLGVASFPLQPLLALRPAPDLLLTHFQEQGLLLVLVEGAQHVGVDVHVLQDLLQHAGGGSWGQGGGGGGGGGAGG